MNKRRVAYIWEQNLIEYCDCLPAVKDRVSGFVFYLYIYYFIFILF